MTKKKEIEAPKQGSNITNSHFEVHASANEHTRAAVEALAQAAAENARAISAIASALKGGDTCAIRINY